MQLLKKTILLQSHSARVLYRPPWFARIAELQGPSIKLSPGARGPARTYAYKQKSRLLGEILPLPRHDPAAPSASHDCV